MKDRRTEFRWFWPWQEERETEWLQERSRRGLHLEGYVFGLYSFRLGEPREYLYRLDFVPALRNGEEEYLALFRDAGWEHLLSWGPWHYFRAEKDSVLPTEIYTDRQSVIAKERRILAILLLSGAILLSSFTLSPHPADTGALRGTYAAFWWLRLALIAFLAYAGARMLFVIRKTRRK